MFNQSKLKQLCQCIIEDYTYHVRDEVHLGRIEYKETGIDDNLVSYRELFLELLSLALGLEDREPEINSVVKKETVSLIRRDLNYRKYRRIIKGNRALIYRTCAVIFDSVIEGIGGELVENK